MTENDSGERRRATIDDLQTPRLDQEEVELSDGSWVLVRALTRDEVAESREVSTNRKGDIDLTKQEYELVSRSMVDPDMSAVDVEKWARAAPAGDMVHVMDRVKELSRLGEDAHKSDLPGNRRERRAALRSRSRA